MNTKHFIVAGLTVSLIAGCCNYTPGPDDVSKKPQLKEHIELVGFQPGNSQAASEAFKSWLGNQSRERQELFRVQEYDDKGPIGKPIGGLEKIECALQKKIDFFANHLTGGKGGPPGPTKFGGQVGASCSTSCKPPQLAASLKLVDDFRKMYGPDPVPREKKWKRKHHDQD